MQLAQQVVKGLNLWLSMSCSNDGNIGLSLGCSSSSSLTELPPVLIGWLLLSSFISWSSLLFRVDKLVTVIVTPLLPWRAITNQHHNGSDLHWWIPHYLGPQHPLLLPQGPAPPSSKVTWGCLLVRSLTSLFFQRPPNTPLWMLQPLLFFLG